MAVIQVQKEKARKRSRTSSLELLAELCYYYPAYTLRSARNLPFVHVKLLLKVARQLEASKYLNLTQIVAAPHSKDGKMVKKLIDEYKGAVNNG